MGLCSSTSAAPPAPTASPPTPDATPRAAAITPPAATAAAVGTSPPGSSSLSSPSSASPSAGAGSGAGDVGGSRAAVAGTDAGSAGSTGGAGGAGSSGADGVNANPEKGTDTETGGEGKSSAETSAAGSVSDSASHEAAAPVSAADVAIDEACMQESAVILPDLFRTLGLSLVSHPPPNELTIRHDVSANESLVVTLGAPPRVDAAAVIVKRRSSSDSSAAGDGDGNDAGDSDVTGGATVRVDQRPTANKIRIKIVFPPSAQEGDIFDLFVMCKNHDPTSADTDGSSYEQHQELIARTTAPVLSYTIEVCPPTPNRVTPVSTPRKKPRLDLHSTSGSFGNAQRNTMLAAPGSPSSAPLMSAALCAAASPKASSDTAKLQRFIRREAIATSASAPSAPASALFDDSAEEGCSQDDIAAAANDSVAADASVMGGARITEDAEDDAKNEADDGASVAAAGAKISERSVSEEDEDEDDDATADTGGSTGNGQRKIPLKLSLQTAAKMIAQTGTAARASADEHMRRCVKRNDPVVLARKFDRLGLSLQTHGWCKIKHTQAPSDPSRPRLNDLVLCIGAPPNVEATAALVPRCGTSLQKQQQASKDLCSVVVDQRPKAQKIRLAMRFERTGVYELWVMCKRVDGKKVSGGASPRGRNQQRRRRDSTTGGDTPVLMHEIHVVVAPEQPQNGVKRTSSPRRSNASPRAAEGAQGKLRKGKPPRSPSRPFRKTTLRAW